MQSGVKEWLDLLEQGTVRYASLAGARDLRLHFWCVSSASSMQIGIPSPFSPPYLCILVVVLSGAVAFRFDRRGTLLLSQQPRLTKTICGMGREHRGSLVARNLL